MKKGHWLGLGLCLVLGATNLWAEDVVYLKDGSVIHGTITEEVPGKKIKIETNDGNVFVYKMKQIDKITHSKKAEAEPANTTAAEPAYTAPKATPEPNDPHAHFSKFAFTLNAGFWGPYVNTEFNNALEAGTGSNSYDYLPGWFKAGMGLGWFTNNIALRWTLEFSYQPNNYTTDWYWGGYYVGSTEEDTSITSVGTELEADLGLDSIINANNVTTVYLPLIGGVWAQSWDYSDSNGDTETFTGSTTSFGTGIGVRGFDSSKILWDFQLVYRWAQRGNYLSDGSGSTIPDGKGGVIDANVTGLDLNFTIGFLFQ
ncbi:MAG TPA: hypothetical protein VHE12_07980 [bacterium]|nr:hypothetical protein [bacterium]